MRAPIKDMSMRGPLNVDESLIFDDWLAEWQAFIKRVPQCIVPDATFGQWQISRTEITVEDSWHLLRKDLRNGGKRKVFAAPGFYTRLTTNQPTSWGYEGGELMNDTRGELDFIDSCLVGAAGDVLECGLGLGLFIPAALARPEITSLTVLEIEPAIIEYVGAYFSDPRLKIIEADFRTWKPEKTNYNRIWLDTIQEHNEPSAVAKMESLGDVRLYYPKLTSSNAR